MAWFVLTSTKFDFEDFERKRDEDRSPRHLVPEIAEKLEATIHQPDQTDVKAGDRIRSVFYGRPEHWALARQVYPLLEKGDSVYALGCDSGVPLALKCGLRRKKVDFAIAFADPGRKKTRVMGRLLTILLERLLVFVTTDHQARRAAETFAAHSAGIHVVEGQTDCRFFRPPEERVENRPPILASCGVERRDYALLTRAVAGLGVEGRVCFASPNLDAKTQYTLPDPIPDNFEFRRFDFAELRDLYQQAEVVVVPLLENEYSAGLTTLFEAMACAAPVVVTESPGIIQELVDSGFISGVPAGDVEAMGVEVEKILANPAESQVRARRGRRIIVERYSAARYLDNLQEVLVAARPLH